MTNRAQITRQAARDGVPAPTVERDYVLAHIMAALGAVDDGHGLVFKGGTALRLCYFEDYRYSADLDFSVVEGAIDAAYATIETALGAVVGAVDALHLTDHEPKRIAYRGPLGRQRYLKLDITDSELVLNVDTVRLLPRWPDLPDTHAVRVYSLAEIAGEKLRCIMQRMQCRDLFISGSYSKTRLSIRATQPRSSDPKRNTDSWIPAGSTVAIVHDWSNTSVVGRTNLRSMCRGRCRTLSTSSEPYRGSYAPLDCCRMLAGENSCPTFCPSSMT